jgi:hypothetical protein
MTDQTNPASRVTPGDAEKASHKGEYGEGNYKASREYNKETTEFAQTHSEEDIAKTARDAAKALDGEEGADLAAAEAEGKSHAKN